MSSLVDSQCRRENCNKEKKEEEVEKLRDEHFNKYRLMVPQGKVWQVWSVDQLAARSVRPVEPSIE